MQVPGGDISGIIEEVGSGSKVSNLLVHLSMLCLAQVLSAADCHAST